MAKSLVKKGLQLVKSGLTGNDEDPHSREKAGVSVKSRIPKVVQGSSSETGVHYHERRQKGTSFIINYSAHQLVKKNFFADRTFRLKKASIKKVCIHLNCDVPSITWLADCRLYAWKQSNCAQT